MPQEQAAQQFTSQEFAAKVKAKYPVYKDIPDDQLVEKVTAKYPQYKTSIKFSPESQRPDATKQAQAVIQKTPMKPSYAAMGITNAPTGADPHNPANPNVNAIVPGASLAKPEDMTKAREGVSTPLAAAQASILGSQGVGALIGKATAPIATTKMVESGLLGPTGKALFKEVTEYGPSAMQKTLSTPAAQAILKMVGHGITFGAGYKLLEALTGKSKGTPVP